MNALIIAPASVLGFLFSFLLLKRAAQWNAETVGKIWRVTTILRPFLFPCLLYMIYRVFPWQATVFMVASALVIVWLVKKWIATEDSWDSGARVLVAVFITTIAMIHGFALVGIANDMISTMP